MRRTIVPSDRYQSDEISPGVWLERLYPGGLKGPNDECLMNTPGGQGWTDVLYLGSPDDAFQLMLPDIRMPPNQYWPQHWHDCWTAVVLVEGSCCIGDWWMEPGDVFLTVPSLEYGPLISGPQGSRLFEIFANAELSPGGYAPEYHDHPTLEGSFKVFLPRSELNKRNAGNQSLSCDGVEGIWKSRLEPGAIWNLGEKDDPERGIMKDTRLGPGEPIASHSYGDWHMLLVMDGTLEIAGRTLGAEHLLRVAPGGVLAEITAGADGARLIELARTSRGMVRT